MNCSTALKRCCAASPTPLPMASWKASPRRIPSAYVNSPESAPVPDDEMPEDFLKSMRLIKQQFAEFDFDYRVVKVRDRNFFAEPGFDLRPGEYDDLVRAMDEGLIEPGQLYRLTRDKSGNLIAW